MKRLKSNTQLSCEEMNKERLKLHPAQKEKLERKEREGKERGDEE